MKNSKSLLGCPASALNRVTIIRSIVLITSADKSLVPWPLLLFLKENLEVLRDRTALRAVMVPDADKRRAKRTLQKDDKIGSPGTGFTVMT